MDEEKDIITTPPAGEIGAFGAHLDQPNPKDYIIHTSASAEELEATLPSSVDISAGVLLVKDQGQEGTCVANAGSEFLEFFDKVELSRRYLYYNGRVITGWPGPSVKNVNEGMAPRDMMQCLLSKGDCREALWPYVVYDQGNPTPVMDADAVLHKIKLYTRVLTVNDLKALLANSRIPAVLTVPIYDGAVNWYDSNVRARNNTIYSGGNTITSGHAILVVGYDDSRQAFKILNSWGTNWGGAGGYAWLPYNYAWNDCWTGLDADGTPDYTWMSQDPYPTLKAGQSVTLKLTLKNTGTADWIPEKFNIGTANPKDRYSIFYNADWLSLNRATTVDRVVHPGETYDFNIVMIAPKRAQTGTVYKEYFCPVVDGLTWLKDMGIYWTITIG